MNRKYKIILGAACVALSIFLGWMKLSSGKDDYVFTGEKLNEQSITEAEILPEDRASEEVITVAETPEPTAESADILVHVCGNVNSPGVYSLSPGSRIYEAVEMAGGFTEEADNSLINLADRLTDGMQIYVPALTEDENETARQYIRPAEGAPETGADLNTGTGSGNAGSRVNINTASKDELMTLSGVGESRADAIIAYRTENGSFASTEEIMNISGIKDGLFGKIKDKITVD